MKSSEKTAQNNRSHNPSRPLIQYGARYVQGYMSKRISLDMLRITRIVDTGSEGDFDWLVNNRTYHVSAGDFMLFNNSDLRMPLVKNKPSDVYIEVLTFSPTALFNATELLDIYYNPNRVHHIQKDKANAILPSFERTVFELNKNDKFSADAAAASLRLLLVDIMRAMPQSDEQPSQLTNRSLLSHMNLLNEIVYYMQNNMAGKLTVPSVANEFNISPSMLSKLFSGMLEMTFPEYLRRLRVNNVVRLVSNGEYGVLDAALESGFGSISGFYKSFSAITGTSPRAFISNK